MYNVNEIFTPLILIITAVGMIMLASMLIGSEELMTDTFSELNTKDTYLYQVVSASCLNDVTLARPETKKFIFDRSRLDKEQSGIPEISCLDFGTTKYKVYIRDLTDNRTWILRNYIPLEYDSESYPIPDVEQVIQINDYTTPPPAPDVLIDFDKYRKGLVSASFQIFNDTLKLPNEMICEGNFSTVEYIFKDVSRFSRIRSSYYYLDNDCNSGNCIKGPRQLYATCQPEENTYLIESGSCANNAECMSGICDGVICIEMSSSAELTSKLSIGQPCISSSDYTKEESCITGYCMYGRICACNDDSQCGNGICDIKKGICL